MDARVIAQFKKKVAGEGCVGIFMKTGDPAFVETAGYAGLDFAILDMEHGPVGYETMQNNIRAAQVAGIFPIVRVEALSAIAIAKALDIGAMGVQVPQVSTPEEAERAVRFAKYHPLGERGVCRFVRASRYSALPGKDYFKLANQTLVIIQLEGAEAIRNLDAILAVRGVDIVFIGPYDLSQSLGVPGETTHPKVVAAMRDIVKRAAARKVVTGTFTDSPETMRMWMKAGVKYISYSTDVGIFREACQALAQAYRGNGGSPAKKGKRIK